MPDLTYEITEEKNLIPSQKQILPIPYINIDENNKINVLNTYTGYNDIITIRYKLNEEPTEQDEEVTDDLSLTTVGKYYFRAFSSNSLYEASPSFIVNLKEIFSDPTNWQWVQRGYIPNSFYHSSTRVDLLLYLEKPQLFIRSAEDIGLQYSLNGIDWSSCNITGDYNENLHVKGRTCGFDGEKYVLIDTYNRTTAYTGYPGYECSLISTDGINWTSYKQGGDGGAVEEEWVSGVYHNYNCVYGNGKFVFSGDASAVNSSPSNVPIFYSTDGKVWTKVIVDSTYTGIPLFILYGNNKFILHVSNGTEEKYQKIYESEDAINWADITSETENIPITDGTNIKYIAKFLNDSFIVTTSWASDNFIYSSKDGKKWNKVEITNVSQYSSYFDVEYINGYYYMGIGGKQVVVSKNLINWTSYGNNTFPSMGSHNLVYGKNMLLSYEYSGISSINNYVYTTEI